MIYGDFNVLSSKQDGSLIDFEWVEFCGESPDCFDSLDCFPYKI